MNSNKRLFLAVFFSAIIFFGYSALFPPTSEKEPAIQTPQTITTENSLFPEPLKDIMPVLPIETLREKQTDKFIITYSTTKGYIKKIALLSSGEVLNYENIGLFPNIDIVAGDVTKNYIVQESENSLFFKELSTGETKKYIFDGHHISLEIKTKTASPLLLFSVKKEKSMLNQRYQEMFFSTGTGLKKNPIRKAQEKVIPNVVYAGARDRYYCIALLKNDYDIKIDIPKKGEYAYFYLLNPSSTIDIYIGPQIQKELQVFELQEIINYGFFHFIAIILVKLLYAFYFVTRNWGFSVVLLALLVYFILFPFTSKSTKAMNAMRKIQPEMEKLKEKHKKDPQRMNIEIMNLYKKNKVNPLGGCLPLFFQMPVFIALYQILPKFVELKGSSFLWIKDLSLPDNAFTLPFTLPFMGDSVNLLPIIIMIISIIQQKFMAGSSGAAAKQQKAMGLFFAVFIGVIFYNFPSCLVLYWLVQNLLTLLYQIKTSRVK